MLCVCVSYVCFNAGLLGFVMDVCFVSLRVFCVRVCVVVLSFSPVCLFFVGGDCLFFVV